jgi:flagellar P-ring protein FlgI
MRYFGEKSLNFLSLRTKAVTWHDPRIAHEQKHSRSGIFGMKMPRKSELNARKTREARTNRRDGQKAPHWVGFAQYAKLGVMLGLLFVLPFFTPPAAANSRIKDIVDIENVRENQLIGYGLVVGLKGTGDSLRNAPFTQQSLQAMLERLGVNIRNVSLNTQNVAGVTVTATLPPFARRGSRIDITISALGDADNLQGGTLLVTPLVGLDGEVYAVAQGPVAVSGFSARGAAESISRGVTTSGRISNGALIEREVGFDMARQSELRLALRNPDLTTAHRVAAVINEAKGAGTALAEDPTTVRVRLPQGYEGSIVRLMSEIELLPVAVDQPAKVVIDEASGIIVMGADVKISRVAIAQGNLTVRITETPQVSQPNPLSQTGTTQVVPRTQVEVDDSAAKRLAVVNTGVTLQELVDGLNALGIGPRDMISILQAMKAAGALQAELEVY